MANGSYSLYSDFGRSFVEYVKSDSEFYAQTYLVSQVNDIIMFITKKKCFLLP
jgi:hypothetical protein